MDQANERPMSERRAGFERRNGRERRHVERRVAASNGHGHHNTAHLCLVCGHKTQARDALPVSTARGETELHVRCALRFTRDLLDCLQRFEVGGDIRTDAQRVKLSAREVQVLEGMVVGERDREIAARLGMAEHTVKNHAYEIRHKLGARSRTQAAVQAVLLGLVAEIPHAAIMQAPRE